MKMEDENGLELSLGLTLGGSSAKLKGKNASSSETRTEEGDRGSKLVDDFKNYFRGGTQKQEPGAVSQRSDSVKPSENFFSDLSKTTTDADASINLNGRGAWVGNNSRSSDIEEENGPEAGNKRKMLFDEINNQKKREREAHHTDLHDKIKASHISITTEDGSTADNEDVAESEVDGSTSRLVSHHDDGSKRFVGGGGSSEASKEVRGFTDSSALELQGKKMFNSSSENEYKLGNLSYGVPFSMQSVNVMNVPYSLPVKDSNSIGAPSTSGHPISAMMQVVPAANSERSGTQPVNAGNVPMMFGYSPVQLPMLDKDNSWGLLSHPQQFHPAYAGRSPPNLAAMQAIARNPPDAVQLDGATIEQPKGDSKQPATEEGCSSRTEDDIKGTTINHRPAAEGFSFDFSAIKPGVAADVKFGGCGSFPNLPWVSTTAPGPNGRTISGVTYRYSANQIRIVCACHGTHMSPEEFVRHASEEPANADNGTAVGTFPSGNPAASAQS